MRAPIFLFAGLAGAVVAACGAEVDTTSGSGAGGQGAAGGGAATSSNGNGGGGGASSSSSAGGGMDCGPCDFECCNGTCVNQDNDIHNCGGCGIICPTPTPYCDKGKCGMPPCLGALCGPGSTCCLNTCCGPEELCCTIPGPVGDQTICTAPTETGTCPRGCAECMCSSPDTPIATPSGDRPIASIREGDLVYSVDHGRVEAVRVKAISSTPAPNHVVVEVTLATGAVLRISPRHPTADGRTFGDLKAGSRLDGVEVLRARSVPYEADRTFDILPASSSGAYFAGGVLIASTLAPSAGPVHEPTAPLSAAR